MKHRETDATVANAVEAMKLGAHYYLSHPVDIDELRRVIQRALGRRTSAVVVQPGFEKILGRSKELLAVLDQARRAARTNSTSGRT